MALLELVLDELPELTVVLNHLGFWPGRASTSTSTAGPRFDAAYTPEGLEAVHAARALPARLRALLPACTRSRPSRARTTICGP